MNRRQAFGAITASIFVAALSPTYAVKQVNAAHQRSLVMRSMRVFANSFHEMALSMQRATKAMQEFFETVTKLQLPEGSNEQNQ